MPQQLTWGGLPVPYVTLWSSEIANPPRLTHRAVGTFRGIGYQDEDPRADRDPETGALLGRHLLAPGRGHPVFIDMNGPRQRRAIRHMLCQICGRPDLMRLAGGRSLYVLGSSAPITEGETTTAPSVHPACALKAIEHCPPLRRDHAAALVKFSPVWGVAGVVYDPATLAPRSPVPDPSRLPHVREDSPDIPWTLAAFTVISLHGITPVSPTEIGELAAREAALSSPTP
ncbi:hypothetical protein [Streptomyces sp. NPDC004286]|uniref:hypothetical protein n=1 Tax=Streptomyces sp. NPDC004286 TaxID=3364696 RepID=UPI0036853C8F